MSTETIVESKLCRKAVKDHTGKAAPCDTPLPKGQPECRNKAEHVRPLRTGFCGVGACEGKKRVGMNGKPLKPCWDWKHCPCECHQEFDLLYSMMGQNRLYNDVSGYEPARSPYVMPTLEERVALNLAARTTTKPVTVVESVRPDVIPVTLKREYDPTPTGRAARGQLESWVREFCDKFLLENYDEPCTPKLIAESISKEHGTTPSQGAVNAVFERWVAIDFALVAKKPTRFIGYTPDGVKLGLEAMKLREKDRASRTAANASRTLRSKKKE